MADERRWTQAFAASSDLLVRLADEALANYHAGRAEEFDPENL